MIDVVLSYFNQSQPFPCCISVVEVIHLRVEQRNEITSGPASAIEGMSVVIQLHSVESHPIPISHPDPAYPNCQPISS
jgi:hypothetical protein